MFSLFSSVIGPEPLPSSMFHILTLNTTYFINPAVRWLQDTVWTWQTKGDEEEPGCNEEDKVSARENELQQSPGITLQCCFEVNVLGSIKWGERRKFLIRLCSARQRSPSCCRERFRFSRPHVVLWEWHFLKFIYLDEVFWSFCCLFSLAAIVQYYSGCQQCVKTHGQGPGQGPLPHQSGV